MNESYSEAGSLESTPLVMPYKDRSTGLMVFGILTVLLGCLAGLFVPLMLFGQVMAATTTKVPTNFAAIVPALVMYAGLSVALVWLGIGSIMARRWARALLLIFSWSWLGLGLFDLIATAFILPKALANLPSTAPAGNPAMNASIMEGVMVVTFVMLGVVFVILPAIWTFFYNSRHVKATCDARDLVPRWTDACPLPVLGLCSWLMFSAMMLLTMPVIGFGVAPFFGMFLTGAPGVLLYLALSALWAYAAWLLYRLDLRGWWLILITVCVYTLSSILTFARHDIIEMYRLMNYPEAQIEQIQKSGLLAGNSMLWMMLFFLVPFLGYLVFIKKYLRRNP